MLIRWLDKGSGPKEAMLHIPAYTYSGQRKYFFKNPKLVVDSKFDTSSIRLSCTDYNLGTEPIYGGFFPRTKFV